MGETVGLLPQELESKNRNIASCVKTNPTFSISQKPIFFIFIIQGKGTKPTINNQLKSPNIAFGPNNTVYLKNNN